MFGHTHWRKVKWDESEKKSPHESRSDNFSIYVILYGALPAKCNNFIDSKMAQDYSYEEEGQGDYAEPKAGSEEYDNFWLEHCSIIPPEQVSILFIIRRLKMH